MNIESIGEAKTLADRHSAPLRWLDVFTWQTTDDFAEFLLLCNRYRGASRIAENWNVRHLRDRIRAPDHVDAAALFAN